MNNDVVIRPAAEADLEGLALLLEELMGEPTDRFPMNDRFARMKAAGNYHILVAEHEGELLGTVMGIICLDIAAACRPFMLIENVVVAERARGRGIGKKLMASVEQLAVEENCAYIIFVSGAKRTGAHAFYASIGYGPEIAKGFKKYLP